MFPQLGSLAPHIPESEAVALVYDMLYVKAYGGYCVSELLVSDVVKDRGLASIVQA